MVSEIRTVRIEGSTSIRSAAVELGNLNVLVGANGSGKTNFTRALELLGRIVDGELQLGVELAGGASALLCACPPTEAMMIEVETDRARYRALLAATADDRLVLAEETLGPASPDPARPRNTAVRRGHRETAIHELADTTEPSVASIVDHLLGCRVFHFHDTGTNAMVKRAHPTADNLALRSDARNIAAVLARLRDTAPAAYRRIVGAVRQVAPFFRDLVLEPETGDQIRLRWRQVDSDTILSAHQMSDGTLRFVCLATLLLQPNPPGLIVLDEPELGLHPAAIAQVADMARAAATRGQLILATQSVTLLDQFSLDDLIVVERRRGTSVFIRPDHESLRAWLDDYSLGELWQKNLIGGRPLREAA